MNNVRKLSRHSPATTQPIALDDLADRGDRAMKIMRRYGGEFFNPYGLVSVERNQEILTEELAPLGDLDALVEELDRATTKASDQEIVEALTLLLGCYPKKELSEPRVWAATMTWDVRSLRPSRFALQWACAHVRRTCKFVPMIADVVGALTDAEKAVGQRLAAAGKLRKLRDASLERIAQRRDDSHHQEKRR